MPKYFKILNKRNKYLSWNWAILIPLLVQSTLLPRNHFLLMQHLFDLSEYCINLLDYLLSVLFAEGINPMHYPSQTTSTVLLYIGQNSPKNILFLTKHNPQQTQGHSPHQSQHLHSTRPRRSPRASPDLLKGRQVCANTPQHQQHSLRAHAHGLRCTACTPNLQPDERSRLQNKFRQRQSVDRRSRSVDRRRQRRHRTRLDQALVLGI